MSFPFSNANLVIFVSTLSECGMSCRISESRKLFNMHEVQFPFLPKLNLNENVHPFPQIFVSKLSSIAIKNWL